jgi:hypothetical protein
MILLLLRKLTLSMLTFSFLLPSLHGQIISSTGYTPDQIVTYLVGDDVIYDNAIINCPELAFGKFNCVDCNVGIDSGIILTNGSASNIIGPNNSGSTTTDNFWPGDSDLDAVPGVLGTQDACVLEFDLYAAGDSLTFEYVFGSEEYLEYVGTFNDAFAFFISGPGFASLTNIALIPGTSDYVTINEINSLVNEEFYINNGTGATAPYSTDPYYIEYDGFTTVLSASTALTIDEWYHLKLVIADDLDGAYDSGVFLKSNSISVGCVSAPEICNSLDDNCNGIIDDGITETISISAGGPTTFCQGGSVLLTAIYSGATVQWKRNGVNIPGATSATYSATIKGTYTCVTTSPCGTATSTGILVNVLKNPPASITAGGSTTFCAGGSVILTANAGGGLSYQWYKGATLIPGATSINYTATIGGNYKCRVTKTASGCFKNSNVISVSVPCKEGELIDLENSFSIYPNPTTGTFTLKANVTAQQNIMEVYNNLGELIFSKELNSDNGLLNETIEMNDIASGIYFVKVWNKDAEFVINLIVE